MELINNEFSWLQLSDLHIFNSFEQKGQEDTIKNLAGIIHPNFIVVSGDFRNLNGDKKFDEARRFLKDTILPAFKLNEEDIYFVPGNHDVNAIENEKDIEKDNKKVKSIIKNAENDPFIKKDDMDYLISRFSEYKTFVNSFYNGSKVKDERISNPAGVTCINKYNTLNLVFINSALASIKDKGNELVDLEAVANLTGNYNGLPSLVIAHHNPDQLLDKQHQRLHKILNKLNIVAWTCGDTHKIMAKSSGAREFFGEKAIPVLVSGKSVIEMHDDYSDVNVIYYTCKDNQITVYVYEYSVGETEASGFHLSKQFRDEFDNQLSIPLNNCNKGTALTNSTIISQDIVGDYKKKIKNELLLPWLYNSSVSFDAILPELFVTPKIRSNKKLVKYNSVDSLIKKNLKTNIIVTGDAGIGKSTLFKYIFLFKNDNNQFLYVRASDLNTQDGVSDPYYEYVKEILHGHRPGSGFTILLDGIDEAYDGRSEELNQLIKDINELKDVYVWLGWRKEHLNRYRTKELNELISEECCLNDWTLRQSKRFVRLYANRTANPKLHETFEASISASESLTEFSRNPFQLTLLVYLIVNQRITSESASSISLYILYDEFLKLWIEKESKTGDTNQTVNKLTSFAEKIYRSNGGCDINDTKAVIRDLFHFSDSNHAVEFCHRSLAAFLIAKRVLNTIMSETDDLFAELNFPLMDDVTLFIKNAAYDMTDETISDIQKHLAEAYIDSLQISNAVGGSPAIEKMLIPSKNSIVYLLTRIRNKNGSKRDPGKFLQLIDEYEKDVRMQVTIAYGAAKLGLQDMAFKYAKEFYNEESAFALTTRSFSLIYYGDVLSNDLYGYCDDEKVDWTKSREIRFKDLWRKNKNDPYFCILDIPLLHNFYISRGWTNASLKDYLKIIRIRINHSILDKDVDDFLSEKLKAFKSDYWRHLFIRHNL